MKNLFIILVCLFLVAPAIAKWSDTENFSANGVTGKCDIKLSEYVLTISPDELYPGFTGLVEVVVTNVGNIKVDLDAVATNVPDYINLNFEFVPTTQLRKNESTTLIMRVTIPDVPDIPQEQEVNISVAVTGRQ